MKHLITVIVFAIFLFYGQLVLTENQVQVLLFKNSLGNSTQAANCANCDFRGTQELAGVDAHGAHLPGVTLQPCIPNDANKQSLMICIPDQVANMTGINLAQANLFSSCLDGATLDKADLSGADLSNSSVRYASLNNAKVSGIITTNATFCNTVMPDGTMCTDTWTGQGVTIACNCTSQDQAAMAASSSAATTTAKSAAPNQAVPVTVP